MATYYVNGAAAGAGTGADWTNAFTTLAAAVAVASTNGDVIKVHSGHNGDQSIASDAAGTYTLLANISIICVDKDFSDALSSMGTATWIGHATLNRTVALTGAFKVFVYGLTFRTSGATLDPIVIGAADGGHFELESCYLWNGQTVASYIRLGGTNDAKVFVRLKDTTIRFGAVGSGIRVSGNVEIEHGSVSSAGSVPDRLFAFDSTDPGGATVQWSGGDLSFCSGYLYGETLITTNTAAGVVTLIECQLHASATWKEVSALVNRSGGDIFLYDCHSGDTHTAIGHQNALGKTQIDSTIYYTTGNAGLSWKITTTASATFYAPYRTPWVNLYHTGTSAISTYFEVLRDGSATAYQDNQLWSEWQYKVTSGSTKTTSTNDRMTLLGSAADQAAGAGLGSWTGETTTGAPDAWSGKCGTFSTITPAETGFIRGRLAFGPGSAVTVYMDPEIRT